MWGGGVLLVALIVLVFPSIVHVRALYRQPALFYKASKYAMLFALLGPMYTSSIVKDSIVYLVPVV